jgi:hypothetical protein
MRKNHYVLEPKNTIFVRVILEVVIYSITQRLERRDFGEEKS